MDIVTHGVMGVVVASPFYATAPVEASCFMLGSVLPDLDAFSRVFGKRAFMVAHQTYSHALPVIAAIGLAAWAGMGGIGFGGPMAALALALGMLFHTSLDVTNTYGITLWAPFSPRRFCLEWVFFIDIVVIVASLAALAGSLLALEHSAKIAGGYGIAMALYWAGKALLRRRAKRLSPAGTVSLLPSALVPWAYLGCAVEGREARLFRINGLTGAVREEGRRAIYDDGIVERLAGVPEFRLMRELSPAYHVVEVEEAAGARRVRCRDLRTRNFGGRFGELSVALDAAGAVTSVEFNV